MDVSVDEYIDKLVDMCNIKISCMAQVEDTKQFYCDSDDFRLYKPDLDIKVAISPKQIHRTIGVTIREIGVQIYNLLKPNFPLVAQTVGI